IFANHAREHFQVFSDNFVQIENLWREHLLAAEGEELAGERGRALGGAGNFLRGSTESGVRTEAVEEKFRVAGDHHEQVVEVVGDATRKSSHGFHFLGLLELLLKSTPLGHIFGEQLEGFFVVSKRNGPARNADYGSQSVFPLPFRDEAVEGRT